MSAILDKATFEITKYGKSQGLCHVLKLSANLNWALVVMLEGGAVCRVDVTNLKLTSWGF